MFHKVKNVEAISDEELLVIFSEGVTKKYNVKDFSKKVKDFKRLLKNQELFQKVSVDQGGYGVIWDDYFDLDCNEIYENGVTVETPFDNLIALSDATQLWGLNESTLRKAIAFHRLIYGVDVCKYGKQWVIQKQSMIREYGEPPIEE